MKAQKVLSLLEKEPTGEKSAMIQVADNFVRYLIGDRKAALSFLQGLAKEDLGFGKLRAGANYNQLYGDLFKDIMASIEKHSAEKPLAGYLQRSVKVPGKNEYGYGASSAMGANPTKIEDEKPKK